MYVTYNNDVLRDDLMNFVKEHNLSYREFARLSKINVSIISRFMTNDYRPGTSIVKRIVAGINGNINDYVITDDKQVYYIDALDIEKMSIEELERLADHISKVRRQKIEAKLQEIESARKELDEQQKTYEQLLNEEET